MAADGTSKQEMILISFYSLNATKKHLPHISKNAIVGRF